MQSNKNIKELGEKLPLGSAKLISKRTGLTEATIKNFFEGTRKPRITTYHIIFDEAIKILKEIKKKENELKDLIG